MPKNEILATLVRGRTYALRAGDNFIRFTKGRPTPITEVQRAHLERTAFDLVTVFADPDDPVSGKNEKRAKFNFSSAA